MNMLAKRLEFENMNVTYNYSRGELTIDHKDSTLTLSRIDIRDLKEALESIGQQVSSGKRGYA